MRFGLNIKYFSEPFFVDFAAGKVFLVSLFFEKICQLFHDGGRYHIETSPLICRANHWAGFYMITASVMKELIIGLFTLKKIRLENFKQIFSLFLQTFDLECYGPTSLKVTCYGTCRRQVVLYYARSQCIQKQNRLPLILHLK